MIHQGQAEGGEAVLSPAQTLAQRRKIARQLRKQHGNDLAKILPEWKAQTGLTTRQSYYNALQRK
jgi:hypothetical protein